jgi:hypothetical protein
MDRFKMIRSIPFSVKVATCVFAVRNIFFRFSVLALGFLVVSCSKAKIGPFQSTGPEKTYALQKRIEFGEAGDSERFRVSGWSNTEKEITWTEGQSAVLEFAGLPPSISLRLKMTLAGLVNPPQLSAQTVEVYANGQKVATWEVSGKADFTALIAPDAVGSDGMLKIELRTPKATSPKALGLNSDPRVLGVSCFNLVINKAG